MSYIVQFLYAADDTAFGLDYYLKTHMPLVLSIWQPYGLISYKILKPAPGSPYGIQAILYWPSKEAWDTGFASEGTKAVFADIANYTEKPPVTILSEVVGTGGN